MKLLGMYVICRLQTMSSSDVLQGRQIREEHTVQLIKVCVISVQILKGMKSYYDFCFCHVGANMTYLL